MNTRSRRRKQQRARSGAVLVEAIIVCSSLVLMLGLLIGVHAVGIARLHNFQKVRAEAWAKARAGCPSPGIGVPEFMQGIASGNIPIPDAFLPGDFGEASESRTVDASLLGTFSVSAEVKIPCHSEPPAASGNPASLANDLFGH